MIEFEFPECPDRVAIAGDWHAGIDYATRAIKWAKKQNADVVLHVGDFGFNFSKGFLNGLTNELARNDMHLLFVDGNHENHNWLNAQPVNDDGVRPLTERIAHLPRGITWYWGSRQFMALGGAHSVDRPWRTPGVDWWFGETLTHAEIEYAKQQGVVDYLITHDAPINANLPGISIQSGLNQGFHMPELLASDEHRKMVQEVVDAVQPDRVWCGHYHMRADVDFDIKGGTSKLTVLDRDGSPFEQNMEIITIE